ncbi:MAG: gliding motility protein GldN [Paludibacteraceae bacterium]|nr:gliding motility protein GldN [Paludibacteraceae bacterium]
MKKLCFIACLVLSLSTIQAQHQINSYFDKNGVVGLETQELDDAADTLVTVFHRRDDVVWSRTIYRIIDMRYKQNNQLYFPVRSDDPEYRSLFKVIVDAIIDGLDVYEKPSDPQYIMPDLRDTSLIIPRENVPSIFLIDDDPTAEKDEDFYQVCCSNAMLMHYDSVSGNMSFNFFPYENFAKNQLKYIIQEQVFFDKHNSRLYSKIIAIAPMQSDRITATEDINAAVHSAILFWIPFDKLRPYLAKQYVIPEKNDTKRVTFDEFFAKKLYTSYILGDQNVHSRMITRTVRTEKEMKVEQQRIFDELLNFEQDLWEY